jgi:hypothetical protein
VPENGAGIGFDQSFGHSQQAAFPRPAGANQGNAFTGLDREVDGLEALLATTGETDTP